MILREDIFCKHEDMDSFGLGCLPFPILRVRRMIPSVSPDSNIAICTCHRRGSAVFSRKWTIGEVRMDLAEMAKNKTLTTEEKCIAYLEKMRWPEGVRCSATG